MTEHIRQLMIVAQRAGIPAWVSDDRQAVIIRRQYATANPGKTKPVDYRVETLRQLYAHLGD